MLIQGSLLGTQICCQIKSIETFTQCYINLLYQEALGTMSVFLSYKSLDGRLCVRQVDFWCFLFKLEWIKSASSEVHGLIHFCPFCLRQSRVGFPVINPRWMQDDVTLKSRGSSLKLKGLLAFAYEMETIHSFHLSHTHSVWMHVHSCIWLSETTGAHRAESQVGALCCCVVHVAKQPYPPWERKVGSKTTGRKIGGRERRRKKKKAKQCNR